VLSRLTMPATAARYENEESLIWKEDAGVISVDYVAAEALGLACLNFGN